MGGVGVGRNIIQNEKITFSTTCFLFLELPKNK
jgi:hypothetical protein